MELRMSRKERDRLKVVAALAQRRMRQKEASRLLRLSERQVRQRHRRRPGSQEPQKLPPTDTGTRFIHQPFLFQPTFFQFPFADCPPSCPP